MTRPNNLARMTIGVAAIATLTAGLCLRGAEAQDRLPDYAAIIAAPDRTDADRQTDFTSRSFEAACLYRGAAGYEGARYGRGRRVQH